MTDTPGQQPRLPGVRYRKITLERDETTVIDGIPSTRKEPYTAWEPVPPRDWDDVILRGVTAVTLGITGLAVVATTASIGGLLARLIPAELAYAGGAVFTMAWLCCHAVEWLQCRSGGKAWAARIAGWVALAISMGAVITYGHTLDQTAAGVIGGSIDLLSKGLLTLVMGLYQVQLDPGTAHWLKDQEQKLTGKAYLAVKLRRINRHAGYLRAVGGREMDVAETITQASPGPNAPMMLPAPVQQPAAASVPQPAPPLPPAESAAPAPAPASGQPTAAPSPQPAPAAPVPPAPPAGASATPSGQNPAPFGQAAEPPAPQVAQLGPSIRQTVIAKLGEDESVSDEDLVAHVSSIHGDRPKLAETVARYRRQEMKRRAS
ncbi:hypothetical protein [Streptomyces afghaniensis]|uniref:hypothetical protein n=1 Tax=Streptomyces afghaniensis TaxID=66865 RepID=UPI0027882F26|nr:hypothetical protein [Streptomyces afghaniensis]MDQ1018846.1 hypothetical protein [Streptomyces afghaniensis]